MDNNTADQPLDATDAALLDEVARLYEETDPVPPGFLDRLSFGLALDELNAEVAELTRVPAGLAGVRGEVAAVRTETMTFAAESLTAMITVTHLGPDRIQLDGWIAPAQSLRVRLRTQQGRLEAPADAAGRFSFADLRDGFVQLSFHPDTGDDGAGESPDESPDESDSVVVTPSFEL
jgi:hypothetical protein